MSEHLRTALAEAIKSLVENRGATLDAVTGEAALLQLNCVVAEASNSGQEPVSLDVVAAVAVSLLEAGANSLESQPYAGTAPNRAAAARAALGLEDGTRGRPLTGRRNTPGRLSVIAGWLNYQPESVVRGRSNRPSPLEAIIGEIAEYIVRREIEYLVEERRQVQRLRRPPLESAMRIDWLGRFERYYVIWSYINGIRFDLGVVVGGKAEADFDEYALKSLWHYARFVTELERFSIDHGGLWITPDPAAEQRIADAVWKLRQSCPFTEVDDSVLRLAILGTDEMAIFFSRVPRDAALPRLTEKWRRWLRSCACEDAPDDSCEVHRCIEWATAFVEGVDSQWDLLADWYDVPRPVSAVQPGMRRT